ncbi:MAG: hypothetical protein JRN06_12920 [Nitrososphaerota archaeon]|nr:hypothetical protein [Nitrososphaerota archaeon]
MAKDEADRVEFIRLVMEERERMTAVGKELLQLLSEHQVQTFSNLDRNVKLQIDGKVLDLAKHLGNIAGFCDSGGRRVIQTFNTRILGLSMFKGVLSNQRANLRVLSAVDLRAVTAVLHNGIINSLGYQVMK